MGPLTLSDFVGLDTLGSICDVMFDEFRERRFAQPPTLRKMLAAGWYGQKSGMGFYDWSGEAPVPNPQLASAARPTRAAPSRLGRCLSQKTVAVPAFGSIAWTLPSSPVVFLRTCPGGSGRAVLTGPLHGSVAATSASAAGGGGGGARRRGLGLREHLSSGTTLAPVPFVSVSSTQTLAHPLDSSAHYSGRPMSTFEEALERARAGGPQRHHDKSREQGKLPVARARGPARGPGLARRGRAARQLAGGGPRRRRRGHRHSRPWPAGPWP